MSLLACCKPVKFTVYGFLARNLIPNPVVGGSTAKARVRRIFDSGSRGS